MPDSIIEQIAKDKFERLQNVKILNDYANNFTVERRKRAGNAPKAGQTLCVLLQFGRQRLSESSQDQSTSRQVFAVDVFVDPAVDLETDVDAVINSVMADVERAVAGTDDARECGNLAFNTEMGIAFPFTQGAHQGVQVQFIVQYSTAFNDPLTFSAGS